MNTSYPSVCVIGGGISGICAGIKLKKKLNIDNYLIFDENADFGGTWYTHTYPKCGSDVPAVFYCYSFEPNPGWSCMYPEQAEIFRYLKGVAEKHDLYTHAKLNTEVRFLSWNEERQKWTVIAYNKVTDVSTVYEFDFVIAGIGGLNRPLVPDIFKGFSGKIMHSMEWDHSFDLHDKTVAVIGSGTSAVQIVPGIVNKVKKMYSFQRRPAWVVPKPQIHFSKSTKATFSKFPFFQKMLRSMVFLTLEAGYMGFRNNSVMNTVVAEKICQNHRNKQVKDPELRKKLTPDYPFACKRLAPSNEYYPALSSPNVEVIRESISKVKGKTIFTEDGKEYNVDVLILATGYTLKKLFEPAKVTQTNGNDLVEDWDKNNPSHYLSCMTNALPNFFFLMGPNGAAAHSSAVFTIECQMNYAVQVIKYMLKNHWTKVCVREEAEDKYMKTLMRNMNKTVFGAQSCNAWFKNERGVVIAIHSGNLIDYWKRLRKVKLSHLNFSVSSKL